MAEAYKVENTATYRLERHHLEGREGERERKDGSVQRAKQNVTRAQLLAKQSQENEI